MQRPIVVLLALLVCRVASAATAQSWLPQEVKRAMASDSNEYTLDAFGQQSHSQWDIGLSFETEQRVDELKVDYATLNGRAYEPSLEGQALQFWNGANWTTIPAELTIDYQSKGTFAPVEADGYARWTYHFAPRKTSRIRVLLSQPRNDEEWERLYAVREISAGYTNQAFTARAVHQLGALPEPPAYLKLGSNLAVPESGAIVQLGKTAGIRWPGKVLLNSVSWSGVEDVNIEWWDGFEYRPVELTSSSGNRQSHFLPLSTERVRITGKGGALTAVKALLDEGVQDYASQLEKSRFDLLGERFRNSGSQSLATMRSLLLPLDFAQIAIGRPGDEEETHVTWNGSFLMVENMGARPWDHGTAKPPETSAQLTDRWFAFATGAPVTSAARVPDTKDEYLDGWLPASVTQWTEGNIHYRETLFVTPPDDAVYGTVAELTARNTSHAPLHALVSIVMGRRANFRSAGRNAGPIAFEPQITQYQANDGRAVVRPSGEVVLYAEAKGKWAGTERENRLEYELPLAPGEERTLRFIAPSVTAPLHDETTLANFDFASAIEKFRAYWQNVSRTGMTVDLPESDFNNIYKNLLAQALIITDDSRLGVKYGSYSYEDYFGIEEGWPAVALAQFGYSTASQKILKRMLAPDLMDKSNYHHQYRNGLEPSYAVTAYKLSRDQNWLRAVAPDLQQAAEWTIAAIHGNHDPNFPGILPRHAYGGDIHTPAFSLYSNITCWRGLQDTAYAFKELGQPEVAGRYQKEADAFRATLSSLINRLADKRATPPFLPMSFDIGDGAQHEDKEPAYDHLTPDIAPRFTPDYLGNFWNLFAPMMLELKFFKNGDPRANWIPDYMEQHGGVLAGLARFTLGLDQIYGKGYYESLLERGYRDRFETSLYGIFAHGMSQSWNSFPEVAGIYSLRLSNLTAWKEKERNVWNWGFPGTVNAEGQPLSAGPGMALQMLRMALLRESIDDLGEGSLRLLDGVPKLWFQPGKRIAVAHAPTFFGKISFDVSVEGGRLIASVRPDSGFSSRQIFLRLQTERPLRSVHVNGQPAPAFAPNGIRLIGTGPFEIQAEF